MSLPLNAFPRVRPRGAHAAPAAAKPQSGAKGRRPPQLRGSGMVDPAKVRVLDGKPMATLAPRSYGSPAILESAPRPRRKTTRRARLCVEGFRNDPETPGKRATGPGKTSETCRQYQRCWRGFQAWRGSLACRRICASFCAVDRWRKLPSCSVWARARPAGSSAASTHIHPHRLIKRWEAVRAKGTVPVGAWTLRRVMADAAVHAAVRWGGTLYSGAGLYGMRGRRIAVAATAGGGLLAQTLELPSARFELLPAHAQA